MIWLLLSIASSTLIILIFKVFQRYKIDTFHAIVINYLTCTVVGFPFVQFDQIPSSDYGWIPLGLLLGTIFITLFFIIGKTTQISGVAVASTSMKLGYILPIILAFSIYHEQVYATKMIGIALTLAAVLFVSYKKPSEKHTSSPSLLLWILPLVIFLGSGIADSIVQYTEKTFFSAGGFEAFTVILFGTAFLQGFIFSLLLLIKNKKWSYNTRNITAGILLGIPNYGSIYFFFKALNHYTATMPQTAHSFVFPINNIGIVLSSAALAYVFFKEKLNWVNGLGLLLAVASIILMTI